LDAVARLEECSCRALARARRRIKQMVSKNKKLFVAAGLALALTKQKGRERKGLMDNTRLIDLAMKAFALGLCEGHELAHQQLGVRVRTGRSLMQKLLPTTSNTLPREYRMQLRLVYGAGFHLGQWRKFNGLNSNGGEEVRGEDPA
jgi:hypothetical protein